jgi:hypothetical protein
VVRRIVDLLGPMLETRSPARGREDLRDALQGPHERAPELEGPREELMASEPLASSTEVRPRVEDCSSAGSHEGHRDRYFDHEEAPLRPADLEVPAASLTSREVAWDLGQLSSDLSSITPQMEVSTFLSMALVVGAGPGSKKKASCGGARLQD